MWRTADGVVILAHDRTTDRTTDHRLDLTRSEYADLRRLSAGA